MLVDFLAERREPDGTRLLRRLRGEGVLLRSERGAAAVEFGLVLTVLMLLVFGVVEFSRLMSTYAGVRSAAREGARSGSAVGIGAGGAPRWADCGEIRRVAKLWATSLRLRDEDITVTYDRGPGTATIATCPAGGKITGTTIARRSRIVVRVATRFRSVVPVLGVVFDNVDIAATDRRSIFTP